MFHTLNYQEVVENRTLGESMLLDRGLQFVDRHKWPLIMLNERYEIDEFDNDKTVYCVVEENGIHLASLRVRPAIEGSMVEQHFPSLWRGLEDRLCGGVEVTRFCAKPALTPEKRLMVVSDLLLGLCRHCRQAGIPSLFGVVFPAVARVLRQAGWAAQTLRQTQDVRGSLVLAEWVVSELVAWEIQERREHRKDRWRQFNDAGSALRLVA